MKTNHIKSLTALFFLLILFSANLKAEESSDYKINNFTLRQSSWDNFSISFKAVSKNYTEDMTISGYKLEVFAEDGSLLKTYRNTSNFSIIDKNIGSKEKLSVRLSVEIGGEIITKETSVFASEKSVIVKNTVNIPLEDHISIGNVHVDCALMRRQFKHQDKWEKVGNFNDVGVTLFISNGSNKDYVEVPINKKSSNFDLSNYKYFDDLKMQIEKDLYKTNCAEVKYYYQFNWDRNVYVVYGGSKNIDREKNQTVVYSNNRQVLQKLVTSNNNTDGVSMASAE
jgi:hypothetical protein